MAGTPFLDISYNDVRQQGQGQKDEYARRYGYPGWKELEASYGSGGGGGTSAQDLINTVAEKYQKMLDDYNAKYSEFEKKNPFVFDDVLAEESATTTQRLDPYYQQTLTDYLTGINTKRQRSQEDERTLLTSLNQDVQDYTGANKMNLDKILRQTREGYSDAGLYFSGAQMGATGEKTQEAGQGLDQYLRGAGEKAANIQTAGKRLGEDLALDESQKRRDLATQEAYDVQSQSLASTLQRQRQREFERSQSIGAPPGVSPLDYNVSTFNLLG